jgi:hypothetical protein
MSCVDDAGTMNNRKIAKIIGDRDFRGQLAESDYDD